MIQACCDYINLCNELHYKCEIEQVVEGDADYILTSSSWTPFLVTRGFPPYGDLW